MMRAKILRSLVPCMHPCVQFARVCLAACTNVVLLRSVLVDARAPCRAVLMYACVHACRVAGACLVG